MTRIFTDGAEFGDILFWSSGTVTASTNYARSGTYSYYINNTSFLKSFTGLSEFYFRFAFYSAQTPNWDYLVTFRNGTTVLCGVWLASSYKIHAYVNGVSVGASTNTYLDYLWHLVEVYLKINDSGNFKIKVNGILEVDYAGDTKPGADTTIDNIYLSHAGSAFYFDDFALNDTDNSDGKNDNSWCGDGKIIKLTPSGSSATTNNWLNSGSVSGSANYLYVDEYPYDSDTTYTYASASSTGVQDQYALSDFTGPTRSVITRIFPETRAKMATSGSDVIKIGYLPSGGTDQLSGSIALTTNYTRIVGTSASANPVTGLPWTIDDINGLEYVIEVG